MFFRNLFKKQKESGYKSHPEAVIISCFFNPQKSEYRRKAFMKFYESIKHTNFRIIECVIGDDEPEFSHLRNVSVIRTKNLLWHKESLLNKIVSTLPEEYKFVFWVDADVIFDNENWIVEGVQELHFNRIIQPFEWCIHLQKDMDKPDFDFENHKKFSMDKDLRHPDMWRSFCANYVYSKELSGRENYDIHGHVGFAWGARREVLDEVPLFDKALVGGADHIIAHAAAGQIGHSCITKSFSDDLENVNRWSSKFYSVVQEKIGYVKGNLFHIWHGDLTKRSYLKRIQDFTPKAKGITKTDENGLYLTNNRDDENYMMNYFLLREVVGQESFLLENKDESHFGGFGGGHFGGAGAGGSFEDTTRSENFS